MLSQLSSTGNSFYLSLSLLSNLLSFLLFFCLSVFCPLTLFHCFGLFLLTAKQEKDVLYRLGSTGPQLPNNTLIYQPPPARLHEEAVLLTFVRCYLQPARQAVCISGCTSLGCVRGNEMALLVMYLASPVAETCLCIYLAVSPPGYIYWQKEWKGDWWSQLVFVL